MNESIQVEPFEAKFGDVEMKFHNLKLIFLTEVIIEGTPGITGYTGIFHNVEIHQSAPTGKDCAGEIAIMFRNQGKEFSSCLELRCNLVASSKEEKSGKSLFTKMIQYLFEWTERYVEEKSIKDISGEPFILPKFKYSKDQFTMIED